MAIRSVCLFCGSANGGSPSYVAAARRFGRAVADAGLTLVYGGGNVGLMGAAADAALAAGGEVVGVIPAFLQAREVAHDGLTTLHVTETMHERKAKMAALADAFVALPGGFGTLDELFEIVTWSQLGVHAKPIGLLDVDGFYQPLLAMVRHMREQGFIRGAAMERFCLAQDVDCLLAMLCRQRHAPKGEPLSLDKT
ncbi:MAG: TIGR00730 family Rossman fold protein [Paludibacterium sp.]|uniref:LOG family protein n=1 Tax=Paludibacterium sp. TaxID=1917523 RepID=UPI0025E66C0B|nr:TIGR00730 family Rossman fold protein [Paludibacterium sp.]MBV8046359.1 TIGR00730 family Rossman fold protein [Paludibacterium sp.]MBV8645814.1 TIGR00730 family Rossman fold protein [Paludibacterium sp.]